MDGGGKRQDDIPTLTTTGGGAHGRGSSTIPATAERFAPGAMLAGRYRIVSRIGRGGMGEVYRADDLKLGQSVALKFLPHGLARDEDRLRRLHAEVRIAREVAHPNICRTYDIVEANGEHFIAMEHVDGEDLAGLLMRIGRLPRDKAGQIARQLCAGLAALHERGVLHRDLKPSNVMLDGRGNVRITDFGIAALAHEVKDGGAGAGTPAYMAPEQLSGREVTVRSDLYALGLVLYEIYTGREAYKAESLAAMQRMRESGDLATPSSLIDDMDPVVERVILRCLETEPRNRPPSAIAVAAALPGGDPLAMAIAAGETPSPEMVAQAGEAGGLRPGVAVLCLAALIGLSAATVWLRGTTSPLAMMPPPRSPVVLADRAEEIARRFGYEESLRDTWWSFEVHNAYLEHIEEIDDSPSRWDRLKAGRPAALGFGLRASPIAMAAIKIYGAVDWMDPPFEQPGMVRMMLDGEGRLVQFAAVPPLIDGSADGSVGPPTPPPGPVDWSRLFAAAGLDQGVFSPAAPIHAPPVYCDERSAWTGAWPEAPEFHLRIEAGACGGNPAYFALLGPWDRTTSAGEESGLDTATDIVFTFLLLSILGGAGLLAARNLRARRGDRRGAFRLAVFTFVALMAGWAFSAHHQLAGGEGWLLMRALVMSAGLALLAWGLYIALEPSMRRHWPRLQISWSRLLSGRLRDPMVGRDVLLGCIAGVFVPLLDSVTNMVRRGTGRAVPADEMSMNVDALNGGRGLASAFFFGSQSSVLTALALMTLLLLLRLTLRRPALAATVFAAIIITLFSGFFTYGDDWPAWGWVVVSTAILCGTLLRLGVLSFMTMWLTPTFFFSSPITVEFDRWHAAEGLVGPLIVVAVGAWGFWVSLAGRPLFKDDLAAG